MGDFNGDGYVNGADLNIVLSNMGQTATSVPPQMVEIVRLGSGTTNANSVQFVVVFSEGVHGVNAGDFSLVRSGTVSSDAAIASVDSYADGAVYVVTVNNVFGTGTLGLNLLAPTETIMDAQNRALTGAGTGSTPFVGQTYSTASPFVWVGLGADDNWSTSGNWQGGAVPTMAGESVQFTSTSATTETSPDFATAPALGSIEIASSGYTLEDTGGSIAFSGSITVDPSVTATISAGVSLGGSITVNVGTGSSLTISGVLSDGGGVARTLTKTGDGVLSLTGQNTYTGTTTINGGTISFASGSLADSSNIVFNGCALQWAAGNTDSLPDHTMTITGGTTAVLDTNSNDVMLNAAITDNGGGGSLVETGGGSLTLAGALELWRLDDREERQLFVLGLRHAILNLSSFRAVAIPAYELSRSGRSQWSYVGTNPSAQRKRGHGR